MTEQRVRFRDVKPYEVVESLGELHGPDRSPVTVPVTIHWSGPHDTFDVSDRDQRVMLYSAVLSNGRRGEIAAYINRALLIEDWPYLTIDARVVDLWSAAFGELAASGRDGSRSRP